MGAALLAAYGFPVVPPISEAAERVVAPLPAEGTHGASCEWGAWRQGVVTKWRLFEAAVGRVSRPEVRCL